jgi:DNA mismatch repair protein MutL
MYAILRASIKHSLGQFNVAPVLDFERDANLDTPYHYKNQEAEVPTIQIDRSFNPFVEDKPNKTFSTYKKAEPTASWESLYVGVKHDTAVVSGGNEFASSNNEYSFENNEFTFENEEVTSSLFNDEDVEQATQKTYQIHKKYIVSPIKSGMIIVDQQRAHQRILYEQFLLNMTVNQASSQQLLFPLDLFYSASEMELIEELKRLKREDILIFAGGVIPKQDYAFLFEKGVSGIFGPGSKIALSAKDMLEKWRDRNY